MNWHIPQISGESLEISLKENDRLFIVGANGSGKSALIQHLVSSNQGQKIRRISAHRQTWFTSGSIDLTPQSRKQFDQNSTQQEKREQSRWRDDYAHQRQSAVLFDLVAKENTRARLITHYIDSGNTENAKKTSTESPSPFDQLNELLRTGTFSITLENANDEEILARLRDSSKSFSIAQMSDGERNAAIIAATVITVEPGTMLLLDEPERHLHRSIIEPFLSALFELRMDCTFVISTHEIALPIANPEARVLIARKCQWEGASAKAWDVELLEPNNDLPEELKRAILGSRKRILFVEGTANSLDLPLYTALFPGISVMPKGSCAEVQRAVNGLRGSQSLHHAEAFGLIDKDNRTEDEVNQLANDSIFALNVCSVETLYYCSDAITAVANQQANLRGTNVDEMIQFAKQKALDTLKEDCLAERMAERRCKHQVYNHILSNIPDLKSTEVKTDINIEVSLKSPFPEELTRFNELVNMSKWDELVARYPLRQSNVFEILAKALKCSNRKDYEKILLAQVRYDSTLSKKLKKRIVPLSDILDAETVVSENAELQ